MPRIASSIASYVAATRKGRASRAVGVTIAALGLLQACNGGDAVAPTTLGGALAAGTVATATVGTTIAAPIRLHVTDNDGRALRGVRVRWTTGDGGSVSPAETVSDGNGLTTTRWTLGPIAGTHALTAHVPGLAPIVFRATAVADRAATIRFDRPTDRATLLGDTLRFAPVVLDRFGNVVTTAPTYTVTSGSTVVDVAGNAVVVRARGTAVLKATVDTASELHTVQVDPATPRIMRIGPDTIVPGATIRIDGDGFALRPDLVDVTVAGVKATVLLATATRIDAVLPLGLLPCQQAGLHTIAVTVAGGSGQALAPLRVGTRVALERGASANVLDGDDVRCTELVAPLGAGRAKYVVAVINTSVTAAATSGFELRGAGAGALAGQTAVSQSPTLANAFANAVASPLSSTRNPSDATVAGLMPRLSAVEQRAEGGHDDFLESQRVLTSRAGLPARAWRTRAAERARAVATTSASRLSTVRGTMSVGDTLTVKALYTSCSAGRDIRARVVYAGSKSLVLEDVAAPRAGQIDEQYRQLGDEFDRVMYPLLQARIGDPLAMNTAMAGDGRVTMLFTRFVNDSLPGVAGYVAACNFYDKSQPAFAASNEDELFYARVPSATESPTDWRRAMRSTVMHEAKHLAAFAERFAHDIPLEEAWLEESTARIAEELYSRSFAGGGQWKGNVGYQTTVQCEVVRCDDRPLMMWKHFSVLQQYHRGVDTLTPIGAAASGDFTYYASGWSLVRWAADQYASDESTWFKELVRGGPATGLANLAQRTGRPAVEMLADWALANAVDDLANFTPSRRQLTFPSWNVTDMNGGLAGMYPGSFLAAPLKARAMSFGAFTLPVARLRAFSSSYFTFEGNQPGSQLLELRGENGALVPPGTLRVAIVRVE